MLANHLGNRINLVSVYFFDVSQYLVDPFASRTIAKKSF